MLLRRTTTLALTTLLASGATLLAAPVAHAAAGIASLGDLQAAVNACGPSRVALTGDIEAPDDVLVIPDCRTILDLAGHDLAVQRVGRPLPEFRSGTVPLTIGDTSPGHTGSLTADARDRTPVAGAPTYFDGVPYPGISTDDLDLRIESGTVTAFGGESGTTNPDGTATVEYGGPGIGLQDSYNGSVTIASGTVHAAGGAGAAGIGTGGGSNQYSQQTGLPLTINGGIVRATGGGAHTFGSGIAFGAGPGVGSGSVQEADAASVSGTTIVTGGELTAIGGSAEPISGWVGVSVGGTGIGGGDHQPSARLVVSGGTVEARGGDTFVTDPAAAADGGTGVGAGPDGDLREFGTAQGDTTIAAGATLVASSGATQHVETGTSPHSGGSLGRPDPEDARVAGTTTVAGVLRLNGDAHLLPRGDELPQLTVEGTGKVLGSLSDPTIGATISGLGHVHNDGAIALTASRVLAASVTGNNFYLSLDAQGGSPTDGIRVFAGTLRDGYRTLPTPIRAGYTLLGWNTEPDGTGESFTVDSAVSDDDVELFAQWTENVVTVDRPTIGGVAAVGQLLTVTGGSTTPADAGSTYVWRSGSTELGTGTTYEIKATDVGNTITVTQSAAKADHTTAVATSEPTPAVVTGSLVSTGGVTVTGTPKVGQQLTATSTVTTTPAATTTSGQWFRGSAPITLATGPTYTLTNADVSATITYSETSQRAGYADLVMDSEPTAPVTGGVITVATPVITGDAVVDGTLTVTPGDVSPSGTGVTYSWRSGEVELGTGLSYVVTPDDVGTAIRVVQTASRTDHDTASTPSVPTAKVAKATFSVAPTASFTGVLRVGEQLTAAEGAPVPVPSSYGYQWFAGGQEIIGATSKIFTLTAAQKGLTVAVKVTAIRAGYVDLPHTSPASVADVAGDKAPILSVDASTTSLRLGQSTTLKWTSTDAITITASGAWSGKKTAAGSQSVMPDTVGTSTYVLTATNDSGTTSAQVALAVSQPAATLTVSAPSKLTAGTTATITVGGLAGGETYSILIGGVTVATGQADATGRATVTVRVPTAAATGAQSVQVIGSMPDRSGQIATTLVKVSKPRLRLERRSVDVNHWQTLTITQLEPGEKVTVYYRGKRLSSSRAKASSRGIYQKTFRVGSHTGRKTVRVTTAYSPKRATTSFRVTR